MPSEQRRQGLRKVCFKGLYRYAGSGFEDEVLGFKGNLKVERKSPGDYEDILASERDLGGVLFSHAL